MANQKRGRWDRRQLDRKNDWTQAAYVQRRRKRKPVVRRPDVFFLEAFNQRAPAVCERSDAFMEAYRAGPEAVAAWHEKYDRRI